MKFVTNVTNLSKPDHRPKPTTSTSSDGAVAGSADNTQEGDTNRTHTTPATTQGTQDMIDTLFMLGNPVNAAPTEPEDNEVLMPIGPAIEDRSVDPMQPLTSKITDRSCKKN